MKTLHVTNAWHASSGGIATFYRALMNAANLRGHSMTLVVPGEQDGVECVGAHGRIYSLRSNSAPLNADYRLISPRAYLGRNSQLRRIVDAEQPDLLEVCDKYTLNYFAGMLRVGIMGDVRCRPVVIGLSCERMDDNVRAYLGWNGLARWLVRFYMKWLYFALFDHHIANSRYTAEELRVVSAGHPIRRGVWVRPMGVDLRELTPAQRSSLFRHNLLQRVRAGGDAALLLYVGRLAPEKNLGLLLETLSKLQEQRGRDWRLVLVGDGVGRKPLLGDAARRRLQDRVAWLGHVRDRRELAQIYANCDAFLHPNPCEPFGIAPLEAMSSGLPLIAPDRGGLVSYANSSNAWTVSPTAEAFAEAVCEAVFDPAMRARRVAGALATAEQFRWENVANSFLDLYEDLWRSQRANCLRSPADFVSTPPAGSGSPIARMTAGVLQRLLVTR